MLFSIYHFMLHLIFMLKHDSDMDIPDVFVIQNGYYLMLIVQV